MAKSISACNSILALIFNTTAWADLAQNDGSGPLTNLYISLHTSDPGINGSQLTNEVAYTSYVRVAVVRSTAGWTAPSGGRTTNVSTITFAPAGGNLATITHIAIGTAVSGAGVALYVGLLDVPITLALRDSPIFLAGTLDISEG